MLKLQDLSIYLNGLLPSEGVNDYCPNGLQVEGKEVISKIGTGVSASLETIEKAIETNVDVLLVHHGLFWQRDSYVVQGIKKKKLKLLLEHGLSLFAYHLPLDLHVSLGNNWRAAQEMGWTDLEPFGYMNNVPIGVKGKIEPCSREEFKARLEDYYRHPAVCALGGKEKISSVSLISGGAHRQILDALKEGVDAFITGSFDEPVWHQAFEEKINFFALGHSATERIGPIALSQHLRDHFQINCEFIDVVNPF